MIVVDAQQGSSEWIDARLGIPTASEFKQIITSTGRLSKSRDKYMARLIGEWHRGYPLDEFQGNEWTEYGKAMEPKARGYYKMVSGLDVTEVGFCYRDDARMVGCSPDALVGDDGLWECKAPGYDTHLLRLIRDVVPPEHRVQVQGQLWCTERDWCDYMNYHPELPPLLKHVEPDEKLFYAFEKYIPVFIEELLEGRQRLVDMGLSQGDG